MMVNLTGEERATQWNETKIKKAIQKPSMSEAETAFLLSHTISPTPLPAPHSLQIALL